MVAGAGVVVGGGRGGWMKERNLCCISIFMLKSTKSLNDLSEDSSVFMINRLVSMRSIMNLFP